MTTPIPPGTDPMVVAMSSTTAADPHDAYRWLRDECPVGLTVGASGDATVVISRHEDVIWALRHPEVFSSSAEAMSIGQDHPLIPLQVDPPSTPGTGGRSTRSSPRAASRCSTTRRAPS